MPERRVPRFTPINRERWSRKAYFNHYFDTVRCTFSVTANIDISALLERCKATGVKFTPAMVYCIAAAVNRMPEFRVCFDSKGTLGAWDFMSPCYAVFHGDDASFSNIWTPYSDDFYTFHVQYLADMLDYGKEKALFPKPDMPDNYFTISSLPWIDFTGFNINVFGDGTYLRPIFTLGQYTRENGVATLPLAIQAHHAVCDGYHVGTMFEHVRHLVLECARWLS